MIAGLWESRIRTSSSSVPLSAAGRSSRSTIISSIPASHIRLPAFSIGTFSFSRTRMPTRLSSASHHCTIGPMIVIAKNRKYADTCLEARDRLRATCDIVFRMRDVVAGQDDEVRIECICSAASRLDSRRTEERTVVQIGELSDSKSFEFSRQLFDLDWLARNFDPVGFDHRSLKNCGQGSTRTRLTYPLSETAKNAVFHPA